MASGFAALDDVNRADPSTRTGDSHLVRGKSEALRAGAGPPVSHGYRHRTRDRGRDPGLRLSRSSGCNICQLDLDLMNWLFEADLKMGRIKSPFDIARRVDVFVQQQHQRDHVGRQGRGALPLDHLRGAAFELRVRHGPAHLHAIAEDCRGDGNALLSSSGISTPPSRRVESRFASRPSLIIWASTLHKSSSAS